MKQQVANNMRQPFQQINNGNNSCNGGNGRNNYYNRNGGSFGNRGNGNGNDNRNGGRYGNSRNENGNNNGYNGDGGGGGNLLNYNKWYENNNYCSSCGHDLPGCHKSQTCDKPGPKHQLNAHKKNTMGGSKAKAHNNIMPSTRGAECGDIITQ